jgi:hypothetical protein
MGPVCHDDWKVNSKLTQSRLAMARKPLTERYSRSVSGLDFNAVQPLRRK